ncbi:MAG: UDP-N-acetylmuramoyl-L-alanine--D-glutamate ligase, partial [Anaerolineae bacterium]
LEQLDTALDSLQIGPLQGALLAGHELLIRSPGISPYREELAGARAAGVQTTTPSNLWFAEYPQAATVCITGTKGKSTTTSLVAHLLRAAGVRAEVAGNIGRPLLDCDPRQADWWVVELSSYQIFDLQARPRLAALLNLSDEHIDWHRGAGNYRRDKLRLADMVSAADLVVNHADAELRAHCAGRAGVQWFDHPDAIHVRGSGLYRGGQPLLASAPTNLPGRHNLSNIAAALTIAGRIAPLPDDLPAVLRRFEALPHRLAEVHDDGRVRYVDDSLATTPVATLAALDAFKGVPVVVLVGGFDRGLDWRALAGRFHAAAPYALVGMPDSGPDVLEQLRAGGLQPPGGMHLVSNLEVGVGLARQLCPAGGIVLLSPGAPSFPRFENYRERGLAFAAAARG